MTAAKFHALLGRALAEFEHGPDCFEAPTIASNPSTGSIAVLCKNCGKVVEITRPEKEPLIQPATEMPEKVKPRFKIP